MLFPRIVQNYITRPNTLKVLNPPKNPKLNLSISQITPRESDFSIDFISRLFHKYEPVSIVAQVPLETLIQDEFSLMCKASISENLAFKVNNRDNGDLAGMYFCLNRSTLDSIKNPCNGNEGLIEMRNLFSQIKTGGMHACRIDKQEELYEQIYIDMIGDTYHRFHL